jgi:carboxylesterase type B
MVHGFACQWIVLWLISSTSSVKTATATNVNNLTAPIVDVGYAQYQGYFDAQTNITNFLSIRYAAPPVGEYDIDLPLIVPTVGVMLIHRTSRSGIMRFQAPQPPVPVSGIQPAMQNPDMCYQTLFGANLTASNSPYGYNKRQSTTPAASEDCLFLK